MEELVKIKKSDLIELVRDQMKLNSLESSGVDNWSYYGYALCDDKNYEDSNGTELTYSEVTDLPDDKFYNEFCKFYEQE